MARKTSFQGFGPTLVTLENTKPFDVVFSYFFYIFESNKNWTKPLKFCFYCFYYFRFHFVLLFFFNRNVFGFSCEKMWLNYIWSVSILEYIFHGQSRKKNERFKKTVDPVLEWMCSFVFFSWFYEYGGKLWNCFIFMTIRCFIFIV